jgi:hypothetical protein
MIMENKINLSYSLNSYAKCFIMAQKSLTLAEREERLLKRIQKNRQKDHYRSRPL